MLSIVPGFTKALIWEAAPCSSAADLQCLRTRTFLADPTPKFAAAIRAPVPGELRCDAKARRAEPHWF